MEFHVFQHLIPKVKTFGSYPKYGYGYGCSAEGSKKTEKYDKRPTYYPVSIEIVDVVNTLKHLVHIKQSHININSKFLLSLFFTGIDHTVFFLLAY